ncbi:hypothetical protein ABIA39_004883 [Nocardia sp. GAS34]|uniref:hypothetical protein n=1 Tax=unclassified Nocardia TaxID=2637762 RepID=UPI003D1E1F11
MKSPVHAFAATLVAGTLLAATAATADATPGGSPLLRFRLEHGVVVATLDHGRFAVAADRRSVQVRDDTATVVTTLPLEYTLDGQPRAIAQQIAGDGHTLRLIPDVPLHSVASPLEDQLAANDSTGVLATAVTAGAVGGAVVGLAVAGASCLVLTVACLPLLPVGAGAGAVLGTIGLGLAAGVYSAWNYLSTVASPPGQSRYATPGGFGTNGGGTPDDHVQIPNLPSGSQGGSN